MSGDPLTLFPNVSLHLEVSLLNELDVFDFGFKSADLEFLGLDLRLIGLEAFRVVAHFVLDLIELLHVVIDLF